jgi:hypothetical protein
MELVGLDLDEILKPGQMHGQKILHVKGDPALLVVSLNIHRRHLTKTQQASLIVKIAKAAVASDTKLDKDCPVNKGGRGKKNPIKEKANKLGEEAGISEATIRDAMREDVKSSPEPQPPTPEPPPPEPKAKRVSKDDRLMGEVIERLKQIKKPSKKLFEEARQEMYHIEDLLS